MKKWMNVLTAFMLAAAMGACGSRSSATESAYYDTGYEAGYGVANGYYADAAADSEEAVYEFAGSTDAKTTDEPRSETPTITGDMLVYTGSMTIETLTYEDTVKAVRERIQNYKGIIQDQNEWDGDKSWYYTDGRSRTSNRTLSMTVRIPTESFEAFMTDMEGTGKMTNRSENVENISRRYSDNAIEIEALEKQQERLLAMMDAAQSVEEMIMVEERLSEVQAQLNQKKSRQSTMDTDVKYSTIYLNVNEVQKYTPADNNIHIEGFGERLKEAFEESWINFVYFLEELALALVAILPFLVIFGLIIFIFVKIRKAKGLDPNPFRSKGGKKNANTDVKPGTVKNDSAPKQ